MFKLTHKFPDKYWVAVSGGIDSMAALEWLNKPSKKDRLIGILHINHRTGDFADNAQEFVQAYAKQHAIRLETKTLDSLPTKNKEAFWRDQRYEFFRSFSDPVILAHNFDDCVEEYVMCTMVRGYSGTIKYSNGNCIRPFRLWKRSEIERFMDGKQWIEDPSNKDTKYKRNRIRHVILPEIKKINPGVYNIVEKLIVKG